MYPAVDIYSEGGNLMMKIEVVAFEIVGQDELRTRSRDGDDPCSAGAVNGTRLRRFSTETPIKVSDLLAAERRSVPDLYADARCRGRPAAGHCSHAPSPARLRKIRTAGVQRVLSIHLRKGPKSGRRPLRPLEEHVVLLGTGAADDQGLCWSERSAR